MTFLNAVLNVFSRIPTVLVVGLSLIAVVLLALLLWYMLREAQKVKYQFITVASHKLRTPLSRIKVAVSEVLTKAESAQFRKEPYEITEYDERMLKQIAIENNRLIGLVNLLLEVSESEHRRPTYEKNRFNLAELTKDVVRGYQRSQWRNDRAFVEVHSDTNLPDLMADKKRISSVIQVLLENSITYTPAGGKIEIVIVKAKRYIQFSIRDVGMGITPNEAKRIFSKFFRSARAMRIDTEGTGIGLFLACHIIVGHKGRIWFESKGAYQGATFYFTLPMGHDK